MLVDKSFVVSVFVKDGVLFFWLDGKQYTEESLPELLKQLKEK